MCLCGALLTAIVAACQSMSKLYLFVKLVFWGRSRAFCSLLQSSACSAMRLDMGPSEIGSSASCILLARAARLASCVSRVFPGVFFPAEAGHDAT